MNSRILGAVVCALIFNQSLRAFSTGPPANRNGVTGVYCTACHRTNELNTGDGSVWVLGLPAAWVPGQTYPLQVVVTHPTAIRFGFELSAIGANGDQAGDLIAGADGRTRIISADVNGKTVQFIEHTSAGATIGGSNVFQFTYRAPTDANFGSIRFNVAGNAANGNGANTGDFIYAIEMTLPGLSSERQFVMANRGGTSLSTAGAQSTMNAGFARVVNASGTTNAGLAFISYRQGNSLVNEFGFAASAPIRSGTTYVEVGGQLNMALALVNTNSQAATVSFFFTGDDGSSFGQASLTIAGNSQVAGFLDQAPFFTPNPFSTRPISAARTLTFSSSIPVSVMAARTRLNERGEFMLTALPVAGATGPTSALSVPLVGDGAGVTTDLLLVNGTDATETGTLQFVSGSGQSITVTIDGQSNNKFTYSIPARSARQFKTAGSSNPPAFGWVEISPSGNSQAPSVAAVLTERINNVTVTETAIGGSAPTSATRVYAELSGNFAGREPRSLQTGLAVANSGSASVTITIEATSLEGTVAGTTTLSVPARGEVGLLLGDIPGLKLAAPFTGMLWISAPAGSSVSVAGFRARYNERQTPELVVTAFPAFDEAAAPASELVFPQIVDSGGYSTQFVLIGVRGAQSSGSLQFTSRDGQPMRLSVR